MKRKAKKSRSISIRLSMRTYNEIDKILSAQQESGASRKERNRAGLLRRRLDRAQRLGSA